jgi:ABC-type polysaccharide/polyol phosphate export permease
MAAYGVAPSWPMLALPLYLLGTIIGAAGAGILFAALIVAYRDVRASWRSSYGCGCSARPCSTGSTSSQ